MVPCCIILLFYHLLAFVIFDSHADPMPMRQVDCTAFFLCEASYVATVGMEEHDPFLWYMYSHINIAKFLNFNGRVVSGRPSKIRVYQLSCIEITRTEPSGDLV